MRKNARSIRFFLLSLSLSLIVGLTQPSFTQSLSPQCQDLKERIRALAKKDVKADINPFTTDKKRKKIGDLKALFEDEIKKNSCFKNDQILEIYDTEYDSRQIPAWLPIFLLPFLALVLGAWISDSLKKGLSTLWQNIGNWIYRKLAGSSLVLDISLKRYRNKLIENYKELPIIFTANKIKLPMQDVYVPLRVAGSRKVKSESLDIKKAIAEYHRLMITGEPGSGKTLLCKYLSLEYAEGRFNYLKDQPIPILLELYRVSDASLNVETLQQALVEAFNRNNFPKADQFVLQQLKQGNLMLLLDGLDEVGSEVRSHVVQIIREFLRKYNKCRVIITCRSAVYQSEFKGEVDQTFILEDFDDDQIRQFLRAWQNLLPPDHSSEQLICALRERPKIMQLARNPLLLTLITSLYTEPTFVLPHSRVEFYQKATDSLLELRDQERQLANQYRGVEKRSILQHLALYAQKNPEQLGSDRKSIPYKVVLAQVAQELTSLSRKDSDAIPIIDEIVYRSGLLQKIDGGENYIFSHLTLQEYFAALAMREQRKELIDYFNTDPDAWREIVKLWCGLTNDSTSVIEAIYKKDALTGFECLADAQKINQAVEEKIIEDLKTKLEEEAVHKAFAIVAADFRPRGEALFTFLVDIFKDENESLSRRQAAAKILSKTNLPKSARVLAEYYNQLDFAREALVEMGDVAVPELEKWASQTL